MSVLASWTFSTDAEARLQKICSELPQQSSNVSKVWLELYNYDFSKSGSNCEMDLDVPELDPKALEDVVNIFKEYLETSTILPETRLTGICDSSLKKILSSISNIMTEIWFPCFCKFIVSWQDITLIKHSLTCVILTKLREEKESSACTIFAIKELAISKPEKLCQYVLVPLLSDETFEFTDVELLSRVFSILQPPLKDLIIVTLCKKKEFKESIWLLLQPLLKELFPGSISHIMNCIQKHSSKYTKSTVFGRFLVSFCRDVDLQGNTNILLEIIEKHETLLKRQALKYLNLVL